MTLPEDFLLITTVNDADSARLYDLSAALQRRFTTLKMTVSLTEWTFLETYYTLVSMSDFDRLYGPVGTGHGPEDDVLRLRDVQPVGTHFMCETLAYLDEGLSVDTALGLMIEPLLGSLTQEDLGRLRGTAQAGGFADVMSRLAAAAF